MEGREEKAAPHTCESATCCLMASWHMVMRRCVLTKAVKVSIGRVKNFPFKTNTTVKTQQ